MTWDSDTCGYCGKTGKVGGADRLRYECPECKRTGCPDCMPDGEAVPCPECVQTAITDAGGGRLGM